MNENQLIEFLKNRLQIRVTPNRRSGFGNNELKVSLELFNSEGNNIILDEEKITKEDIEFLMEE